MKHYKKKQFLMQISEVPIVSSVCEKIGISRQTYYRWREEDPEFRSLVDKKLAIGCESVNDLAKSVLINSMKEGGSIGVGVAKYWLSNNDKSFVRPKPKGFFVSSSDLLKKDNSIRFVDFSDEDD